MTDSQSLVTQCEPSTRSLLDMKNLGDPDRLTGSETLLIAIIPPGLQKNPLRQVRELLPPRKWRPRKVNWFT